MKNSRIFFWLFVITTIALPTINETQAVSIPIPIWPPDGHSQNSLAPVTLEWTAGGGSSWKLELRKASDGSYVFAGPVDSTSVTFEGLSEGGYAWRVSACDDGRCSDWSALNMFELHGFGGPISGWIKGTITDADTGETIEGAHIEIDTRHTAVSLTGGAYLIIVYAGTWSVTASATGYISKTQHGVVVAESAIVVTDFNLEPALASNKPASMPWLNLLILD